MTTMMMMMMIREARPFKTLACRWTIPPKYLSEPENQSSHKKKEYRQVAFTPQPERKFTAPAPGSSDADAGNK